ncbi:MAG: PIN domain-containing protein [Gammaproteobacteria bacterium]|nr:PIN domain-containing protein [Gammaproteobacteria bacterium]
MSLFVDTSVWSIALRRDAIPESAEVNRLREALNAGDLVLSTGIVLQELLQGYSGPRAAAEIARRFQALPMITPTLEDHVQAANLRNGCRRHGVQVGTIDALLAQLCITHQLTMLSTDRDFVLVANHTTLQLWS